MSPRVCDQAQMKTPEFVNPIMVLQQSPLVAVEVHETKTVGDGVVEEELLYVFFHLKL